MSQRSGQISGGTPHGTSIPSQAFTLYLSVSPTITGRISNNMPDKDRKKRLVEQIASLDVKMKGKGSGNS
ncbi:hypothetical protein KVR01_010212 [Diaporthe batatas]|uniref:uncharacterized protein n=1 Tax=Diaporthe batatas TaxID=748121 RepID=UPI001D04F489|nr:uncharacterized protein KVR01_010212 [Diaporthe batatas]KAG8159575.1 hypothetical protein KVR01_010212 [Diaporthe batatas]